MRKKIQTHNPITTITTIVIHKYKVVIRLNKIHPYMYTYTSIIIEINKPIIQIKSNLIPGIKIDNILLEQNHYTIRNVFVVML